MWEEQPVCGGRQGAVLVHAKPARGPGFPIKAPRRHMRLECGLEGRDQLLKLVEGQAGEIQELRRARLQIGKPDTGHGWCLLSWEAQYIINRDNLIHTAAAARDRYWDGHWRGDSPSPPGPDRHSPGWGRNGVRCRPGGGALASAQ